MKICPSCKTQYSDDTLSFCLQDGTPLTAGVASDTPTVVLGETETVAVRSGDRVNVPVGDSGSAAWHSQVRHVATPRPERQSSNTPIAVAATAVGMLLLVGVVGIAAWIYFKNSGQPPVQSANNSANIPGGGINNGTSPPQTPHQATPAPTRPSATLFSANTGDLATPAIDDPQVRSDVSQRINSWKSRAESLDLNGYMAHYAGTVDYYRKRGASAAFVRADKLRAFSRYNSIRVNLSNMTVTTDPLGQEATVMVDKEWNFQGNGSSSGKVRQLMRLRKINGQWLITAEKDLKVYYKH